MATEEHPTEQQAPGASPAPPAPLSEDAPGAAEAVAEAPAPVPEAGLDAPLDEATLADRARKADEYLGLAQRTQADFENYRKRTTRDLRAAEARGMGRLARELLPALDNLERAVAALEAADEEHHMTNGIRLVTSELAGALARTGIESYAAKGERFDPVCHEAVAQHKVDGSETGTIVEVLQPGYRLHDTILRPARVIVAG
ncbi:MAG: molecular chaperone GrpE [Solirubrobacteraceae bacterium]|nr:molecular chaperone GrpE [Solirubrobacteraceae bacterium]